jgi:tetratricopeptide (TPR) repeat protein
LLNVLLARLDAAEADGRELLALAEDAGDTQLRAHALERLAVVAQDRGDTSLGLSLQEEVATIARETSDAVLLCIALDNLADIALYQGRFEEAVDLAARALAAGHQTQSIERVASILLNMGTALLALGHAAEAAERFTEALHDARQIGSAISTAYALEGLGCATAELGSHETAARLMGAAETARRRLNASWQALEADRHQRTIDRVRDELGTERLARSWDEGRAMTVEATVALACKRHHERSLRSGDADERGDRAALDPQCPAHATGTCQPRRYHTLVRHGIGSKGSLRVPSGTDVVNGLSAAAFHTTRLDRGHRKLPVGGHRKSPLAATGSPHGRPSDLPTVSS